ADSASLGVSADAERDLVVERFEAMAPAFPVEVHGEASLGLAQRRLERCNVTLAGPLQATSACASARAGSAARRCAPPLRRGAGFARVQSLAGGGTRPARRGRAPTSTAPSRARRACGPRAPAAPDRLRTRGPDTPRA